jgi:fluoroquinolone transport system permease protein
MMLLFVPVMIAVLLRLGYPLVLSEWPLLTDYNMLLLALLGMSSAAMPGMALSFAILDERDNNLLPALMVLPVSLKVITINRNIMIFVYGTLAAFITIFFSGLAMAGIFQVILLSLLSAAPAPLLAMIPAFFAKNKIEGATIAKILNFLLVFPLPAFIYTGWWTNFLIILPSWWIYKAFVNTGNLPVFLTVMAAGLIFHLILILLLVKIIFGKS